MLRLAVLALGLAVPAAPAVAACRLALVLALDVSSSVDGREDRLQRDGLAAALIADDVVAAILSQPDFVVALNVFEWSGRDEQVPVLGWTQLSSRADIEGAAAAIAASTRRSDDFPTALGSAMGYASTLFPSGPACERKVIDVSGDGKNNAGYGPESAYRYFPFDGVTVNALAIGGRLEDLPGYYRRTLIRGPAPSSRRPRITATSWWR